MASVRGKRPRDGKAVEVSSDDDDSSDDEVSASDEDDSSDDEEVSASDEDDSSDDEVWNQILQFPRVPQYRCDSGTVTFEGSLGCICTVEGCEACECLKAEHLDLFRTCPSDFVPWLRSHVGTTVLLCQCARVDTPVDSEEEKPKPRRTHRPTEKNSANNETPHDVFAHFDKRGFDNDEAPKFLIPNTPGKLHVVICSSCRNLCSGLFPLLGGAPNTLARPDVEIGTTFFDTLLQMSDSTKPVARSMFQPGVSQSRLASFMANVTLLAVNLQEVAYAVQSCKKKKQADSKLNLRFRVRSFPMVGRVGIQRVGFLELGEREIWHRFAVRTPFLSPKTRNGDDISDVERIVKRFSECKEDFCCTTDCPLLRRHLNSLDLQEVADKQEAWPAWVSEHARLKQVTEAECVLRPYMFALEQHLTTRPPKDQKKKPKHVTDQLCNFRYLVGCLRNQLSTVSSVLEKSPGKRDVGDRSGRVRVTAGGTEKHSHYRIFDVEAALRIDKEPHMIDWEFLDAEPSQGLGALVDPIMPSNRSTSERPSQLVQSNPCAWPEDCRFIFGYIVVEGKKKSIGITQEMAETNVESLRGMSVAHYREKYLAAAKKWIKSLSGTQKGLWTSAIERLPAPEYAELPYNKIGEQ